MAHKLLLFLLVVHFFMRVSAPTVSLGDSVNLTAHSSCTNGVLQRIVGKTPELVARFDGDQWKPEENYKQRIEHLSTTAVRLNNVNVNDRSFEFDCDRQLINSVQLTVVVPCELSVYEGEAASLMCHVPTAGVSVKRITWKVNGTRVVVEANCSSEPKGFDEFKGRVSVPSDRCTTGNMTLTVDQVRRDDHGLFVCYVEDEAGTTTRGNPDAVTMKVRERNPDPVTTTSSPPTTDTQCTGPWFACIIPIVLLTLAAVAFCIMWYCGVQSCRAAGKPAERNGGRDGQEMEMEDLRPDDDH